MEAFNKKLLWCAHPRFPPNSWFGNQNLGTKRVIGVLSKPIVFPCPVDATQELKLGYVGIPGFQWDSSIRKLCSSDNITAFLKGYRFGLVIEKNGSVTSSPVDGGIALYPRRPDSEYNTGWSLREVNDWCIALHNNIFTAHIAILYLLERRLGQGNVPSVTVDEWALLNRNRQAAKDAVLGGPYEHFEPFADMRTIQQLFIYRNGEIDYPKGGDKEPVFNRIKNVAMFQLTYWISLQTGQDARAQQLRSGDGLLEYFKHSFLSDYGIPKPIMSTEASIENRLGVIIPLVRTKGTESFLSLPWDDLFAMIKVQEKFNEKMMASFREHSGRAVDAMKKLSWDEGFQTGTRKGHDWRDSELIAEHHRVGVPVCCISKNCKRTFLEPLDWCNTTLGPWECDICKGKAKDSDFEKHGDHALLVPKIKPLPRYSTQQSEIMALETSGTFRSSSSRAAVAAAAKPMTNENTADVQQEQRQESDGANAGETRKLDELQNAVADKILKGRNASAAAAPASAAAAAAAAAAAPASAAAAAAAAPAPAPGKSPAKRGSKAAAAAAADAAQNAGEKRNLDELDSTVARKIPKATPAAVAAGGSVATPAVVAAGGSVATPAASRLNKSDSLTLGLLAAGGNVAPPASKATPAAPLSQPDTRSTNQLNSFGSKDFHSIHSKNG